MFLQNPFVLQWGFINLNCTSTANLHVETSTGGFRLRGHSTAITV